VCPCGAGLGADSAGENPRLAGVFDPCPAHLDHPLVVASEPERDEHRKHEDRDEEDQRGTPEQAAQWLAARPWGVLQARRLERGVMRVEAHSLADRLRCVMESRSHRAAPSVSLDRPVVKQTEAIRGS